MTQKPNIFFVVVDCLRADYVYKDRAHTPLIDRLNKEGYSYSNTIASTSTTTPSFASLLTGQYPFENGVRSHAGHSLNRSSHTYPSILREKGYSTHAEVTGPLAPEIGLDAGFDEYNYRDRQEHIHTDWGRKLSEKVSGGYYEEPWFLLLHLWPLHTPRIVKEGFDDRKYGSNLYARALSSIDDYLGDLLEELPDDTLIVLTGDHGEQIANSRTEASIKNKLERGFKKLKKMGLTNTHYGKVARYLHIGHGYGIYDWLVRIPLIFHRKGRLQSGSTSAQVRQIDIIPTLLDFLNIDDEINARGCSTRGGNVSDQNAGERSAYLEAVGSVIPKKEEWLSGLRLNNEYKFIFSPFKENYRQELYNLKEDPDERNNIAGENPDIARDLKGRIEKMDFEKMAGGSIDDEEQEEMKERLEDLGYLD